MNREEMKETVGRAAADALVRDGMKLGLGTGSTAIHAIRRVGELLAQGKLRRIYAFPTSFQASIECEKWGIPQYSLNAPELGGVLDLTIDGADEIDGKKRCVKGGGGALLVEKIAAYVSRSWCLVADGDKMVDHLGLSFPVPLEVVPEARVPVAAALEKLGAAVELRAALRKAGPVITEHGNLLLDLRFSGPVDPVALEAEFNRIPGVVENGFFTRVTPVVYVGLSGGRVEVR
jgi:ribose 5-phosphate isomerase A